MAAPTDRPSHCATERTRSHTFYLHVQAKYKRAAQQNVGNICGYGHPHGRARILHAEEPARQCIGTHYSRSTPYTYSEITRGKTGCSTVGIHKAEYHRAQRLRHPNHDHTGQCPYEQCAPQHKSLPAGIRRSICLRSEAA